MANIYLRIKHAEPPSERHEIKHQLEGAQYDTFDRSSIVRTTGDLASSEETGAAHKIPLRDSFTPG